MYVTAVPPSLVLSSSHVVASQGSNVHIGCEFYSVPSHEFYWTKDGDLLESSNRLHLDDGDLVISGAVKTDSGLYQCWATNEAGTEYGVVRVLVRPDSSVRPQSSTAGPLPLPAPSKPGIHLFVVFVCAAAILVQS